ncbi:MAG: class I SAM-dependent methyltransferase [Planctomycetota bacterium]
MNGIITNSTTAKNRMRRWRVAGDAGVARPAPAAAPKPLDLEKIAKAYSSAPWWYDLRGCFILTTTYQATLWSQIRFFGRNIRAKHLEVAVGTGTLLRMTLWVRALLGRPKAEITGMDYSDMMLSGAERYFAGNPRIRLYRGDVTALPEPDGAFESVNIANAFHCFADPAGALREIRRVLAPGGTLAMNVLLHPRGGWLRRRVAGVVNAWGIRKGILVSPFHREDVRRLLVSAGFAITTERVGGNCFSVAAVRREA